MTTIEFPKQIALLTISDDLKTFLRKQLIQDPFDGNDLAVITAILAQLEPYITADHRWVGTYVPALWRAYPFRLMTTPEQTVLSIDQDSGLIVSDGGEAFFDSDGTPSAVLQEVIDFANTLHNDQQMISQGQLSVLAKLARAQANAKTDVPASLDEVFGDEDDELNFDFDS